MKPKLSEAYNHSPVLLLGPLLLIVPETTDGNCERKHVNIEGVMAKTDVEQRSSPLHHGEAITACNSAKLSENSCFGSEVIAVRIPKKQEHKYERTQT